MVEKYALVAVLLAVCIRLASSIHCYDCNSVNNSMCLQPEKYDHETLVKFMPTIACGRGVSSEDQPSFFCRKITQTILHKGYEPDVRVTRGCGWVRHLKACYTADNEDHLETVCQCFEDGCNAASRLGSLGALVVLSALGIIKAIL